MWVFSLIVPLLIMLGAVRSMRRNPATSGLRTLWFLLALLAYAGFTVGLVMALIFWFERMKVPPAVYGIVLGAVFLAFFVTLIIGSRRFNGATVDLPPTAEEIRWNRAGFGLKLKKFAIWLGVPLLIALVLPGIARVIGLIFVVTFVLIFGLALMATYIQARDADREISKMLVDSWMRWKYSPELWRAWVEAEVSRVQAKPPAFVLRRDWKKLWPLALGLGIAMLIYTHTMEERLIAVGGLVLFIVIAVAFGRNSEKGAPDALRKQMMAMTPEAIFGDRGVACGATFTSWLVMDTFLVSAWVEDKPIRCLVLRFEKTRPSGRSFATFQEDQRLPIPADGGDLTRLRALIATKCAKAEMTF